MAAVTSSCSPEVRWTDADLRHLSRPWTQDSFIAATIMSACLWGAQGTGIAGLPDSCPSPGGAAGRSVFPARTSQHAWERVNTLIAGHLNDSRGGTVPLRVNLACRPAAWTSPSSRSPDAQPDPAGSVSPTAPKPPQPAAVVTARPGDTVLGTCPCGGIVRHRNNRTFTYCALGAPGISRRGRDL